MSDLEEHIERYVEYLKKIKKIKYPAPEADVPQLMYRNGQNAEKEYLLGDVIKSLEAILKKDSTKRSY